MKKTYIVIASAIMILFCLMYSVSYAYFSVKVTNDFNGGNKGSTVIGSDTVKDIIISDGTKVTSSNLIPGESVTSNFTIQNPNGIAICFGFDWTDVLNEFTRKQDLVFTLKEENGDTLLEDIEFPSTNNQTIIEGLSIPAKTTKKYILTVTYKNVNEDQTTDMNKKFHATITGKVTECKKTTATETISNLVSGADTSSTDVYTVPDKTSDGCTYTLAYDGTSDNNLRYVGSNPCNYVKIDDELWRIVGVMNNVDDGTGKKESRLKLIRSAAIGGYSGYYSWDTSESSVNNGEGVNEWSQADLMKLLNPGYESEEVGGSLYYNGSSGLCYSGKENTTKSCDFTNDGLKENLKVLIGAVIWNTGAVNEKIYTFNKIITSKFYEFERSSTTGKICTSGNYCNDTVERKTTWTGKVGLIYPSDYGYAISGGSTYNRTTCLDKEIYDWDSESDCYNNNWLKSSDWTISSFATSVSTTDVFYIYMNGVIPSDVYNGSEVHPSVYLKSDVAITGGEGTEENPYTIG